MSIAILDSNIFLRAAAIEPLDEEYRPQDISPHDHFSRPNASTKPMMSPRQCRALICAQLMPNNGVLIPQQQMQELCRVAARMRTTGYLKESNERILLSIDDCLMRAGIGKRIPVLAPQVEEQHKVLAEALSQASVDAMSTYPERRRAGGLFLQKNQEFLVRTLPAANMARIHSNSAPFVWVDWLLCNAAKRMKCSVITLDSDFEYISEAYERVTGYHPAKYLQYYPSQMDVSSFIEGISHLPKERSRSTPNASTRTPQQPPGDFPEID